MAFAAVAPSPGCPERYAACTRPRTTAAAPPEQLVFGFADEFVRLLESKGGLTPPVRYGKTYTRVHDPLVWREAADHLLREAGVRVLFHAVIIGALLDGDRVDGAVAWSKEGSIELRAKLTSMQPATPISSRWRDSLRSSATTAACRTRR